MSYEHFYNIRSLFVSTFGILSFLVLATPALGQTPVSGTITQDTTWTLAGSPCVVTGNVKDISLNSNYAKRTIKRVIYQDRVLCKRI